MRKPVNSVWKALFSRALMFVLGGVWGAFIDLTVGGKNDPVGDGALKGFITVAVVLAIVAATASYVDARREGARRDQSR